MNPAPHHGFDFDAESTTLLLDCAKQATLVDDPLNPRQKAMRALVESERERMAQEAVVSGDVTRMGSLVPSATERQPADRAPHAARREAPGHALVMMASESKTVQDYLELPLPDQRVADPAEAPNPVDPIDPVDRDPPYARAVSLQGEWLEVEERPASISAPMVRAVSDESLARASCASGGAPSVTPVIRSTNPPPGLERSVVVQQVSPFGSDARVLSKPKPKRAIPPQGETLPFASGTPETPPRPSVAVATDRPQSEWGAERTATAQPAARRGGRKPRIVAVGSGEVMPQRYIMTKIQTKPARGGEQRSVRRDVLPLTSALCAVVVAVAALVNVLI